MGGVLSWNNIRLAVAEFGVKLVGFCDELLRAFVRLQLQFGISKFELLYSAVRRGGIEPSLDFFQAFFEINIFVFIIVSRVV